MTTTITKYVLIHGKVQGVGYRNWVGMVSHRLGLEGWVRNRGGDMVEALFRGPEPAVATMIAECRKGPPNARVIHIDEREGMAEELNKRYPGEDFSCLPTV